MSSSALVGIWISFRSLAGKVFLKDRNALSHASSVGVVGITLAAIFECLQVPRDQGCFNSDDQCWNETLENSSQVKAVFIIAVQP